MGRLTQDVTFSSAGMRCFFECCATDMDVRGLLQEMRGVLAAHHTSEELLDSVETAVAEGLNNVVEHALKDEPNARISTELALEANCVIVHIIDNGIAMPGNTVPPGHAANLAVPRHELPEGGFGWALIHMLTDRLDYNRVDGVNHLKMWFKSPDKTAPRALC